MALTTIQDTYYNADGTTANGSLLIAWPTFVGSDGHTVQASSLTYTVTNGVLNINLEPTDQAEPSGVVYTVTYSIVGGPHGREYWAVPTFSSPVNLNAVRVINPPTPGPYIPSIVENNFTFSGASAVLVPPFNFTPLSLGGSLSAGSNTLTIPGPVPSGMNGSNANYYVYISGGTGAAEACLVTGGTAVSGGGTGTLIITCAGNHSGAWTLASASAGIQEAIISSPNKYILLPKGTYACHAPITIPGGNLSYNLGGEVNDQYDGSTFINNLHSGNTFTILTSNNNATRYLHDFTLVGTASSADGINATACAGMYLKRLWVSGHGGHGIIFTSVFNGNVEDCTVTGNSKNGIFLSTCNNVTVDRNVVTGNALTGNQYANITSVGGTGTENLTIRIVNNDIESAGLGGTATFAAGIQASNGRSLSIHGNHLENNQTDNIYVGGNTAGISIRGNFSLNADVKIDTSTQVDIDENTFSGASGGITLTSTSGSFINLGQGNIFQNGAGISIPVAGGVDGGPISSASTVTLPNSGRTFSITGTTGITSITASWGGRQVVLIFAGVLTVTKGNNLKIASNLTTAANTTLTLVSDGVNWVELGRSSN